MSEVLWEGEGGEIDGREIGWQLRWREQVAPGVRGADWWVLMIDGKWEFDRHAEWKETAVAIDRATLAAKLVEAREEIQRCHRNDCDDSYHDRPSDSMNTRACYKCGSYRKGPGKCTIKGCRWCKEADDGQPQPTVTYTPEAKGPGQP
jgi:hypothetical protein